MALLNWLQLGAGAVVGGLVAGALAWNVGHWSGDRAGYDRRIAEVAAADMEAEMKRKGDDAELAKLSDYDLCVAGLGGSGMPVDACEQLRGVPGQ